MKNKIIVIFLLFVLSISFSACTKNAPTDSTKLIGSSMRNTTSTDSQITMSSQNSGNEGNQPIQNKDINSNGTANEQENTNESTGGNKSVEVNETFYGKWSIKGEITSNKVSTYSKDAIQKMIGKTITYSSDLASFDNNECKNPNYKVTTISKKNFEENSYANFESLGIKSDSIVSADIFTDKDYNNEWDSIGCTFYVKDPNTLIMLDGGVYFELDRSN